MDADFVIYYGKITIHIFVLQNCDGVSHGRKDITNSRDASASKKAQFPPCIVQPIDQNLSCMCVSYKDTGWKG